MSRICTVPDCGAPTDGHSMCNKHRHRVKMYGGVDNTRPYVDTCQPVLERMAALVSTDGNGCWNWQGVINQLGYGKLRVKTPDGWKTLSAHRVSWAEHNGEIPSGLHVLHKCDNRACVNPDHLFLGTHQDNMDDCRTKGRKAKLAGQANGFAKLSNADVLEIKDLLTSGMPQKAIATKFGVTANNISHIKLGKKWSSVTNLERQNA